jgi:hypothetical protein
LTTQDQARQKLRQGFPSRNLAGIYWGAVLTKDPRTVERYISGRPVPENVVQAILGHSAPIFGVLDGWVVVWPWARRNGKSKLMFQAGTDEYATRLVGPAIAGWIAATQGRRMDYKGRTHGSDGKRSDAPYVSKDARAVWRAAYLFRKKLK